MGLVEGLSGVIVDARPEPWVREIGLPLVWFLDLAKKELGAPAMSALSLDERSRARMITRDAERRRYVARRAFVRRILGNLTGRAPETLEFRIGRCGKPHLASSSGRGAAAGAALEFSVSSSEDFAGLAVAVGRAVGLDLEVVRPVADLLGAAATQFPPTVLDALSVVPPSERELAFYRLWTQLEAVTKMRGRGLDCPHAREPSSIRRWTLQSFSSAQGPWRIVGALAVENPTGDSAVGEAYGPTPSALPWP